MKELLTQSHMLNEKEAKLLADMHEPLKKGLKFNFKQFVAWMQVDKVFEKYVATKKVTLLSLDLSEDLE